MNDVIPFQLGKRVEDVSLLSKSSFLARLGVQDVSAFLDTLDQLAFAGGTTIFRQGEEGDHMYFVLDGDVRLRRGSVDVSRLGPGDSFGESAILGVRRRPTTASSETTVRLARLSRSRFLSFATNHPRAALHVTEALAASLAATVTAMTDDVGLLLQQRTLPRRATVRVMVGGDVVDVATGSLAGSLLPDVAEGAPVVGALVDHKPVSLETPITSDAHVEPLTIASWEGRRIHRTSVGLLFLEAARRVLPDVRVAIGARRGEAQTVDVPVEHATAENIAAIERQMRELVDAGTPLREELWAASEAAARLVEQGWNEAAALVPFDRGNTISLVTCGGTFALGLGPVVPNAGKCRGFALRLVGTTVLLDHSQSMGRHSSTSEMPIPRILPAKEPAHDMSRDLRGWLRTLGVASVGHFDRSCVDGQVSELIRVSEGFHEKHIGRIADSIAADRGLRIVAIAGPSSSGKTTFIKRLKVQLEVNGIVPVQLSLDDYYVDRVQTPKDASGAWDFEALEAIDLDLFHAHARRLLAGERVRTARYDFPSGKSMPQGGAELALGANNILLVEGLHALNPAIAGAERAFRVFVHPAMALPFDRLTTVLPEDVRLVRRIVRDRHQRGYSASESIRRWPSVRRGEERNVLPCLERADVVFDTSLVYELAVLRVYAERYLLEVPVGDPAHATAYRLRQLIDRFVPIHPDHVPPTSILREFIGGSGFDG